MKTQITESTTKTTTSQNQGNQAKPQKATRAKLRKLIQDMRAAVDNQPPPFVKPMSTPEFDQLLLSGFHDAHDAELRNHNREKWT